MLDEFYVFNSTVDGTPIRGAVETIIDGDTVADSYLPGTILQTYSDWLTPDPYIAFLVNNNLTGNEVYCTHSDNNEDGFPQAEEYSYLIISGTQDLP